MDNTKLAMTLLRYLESRYPLKGLRYKALREQSSKRWAVVQYVNILLDHPNDDPNLLLEIYIGRLACLISHMLNNNKIEMSNLYRKALAVLIEIEDNLVKG